MVVNLDMESLTMQETCIICDKNQEVGDVFYRYEDLGFSLCELCSKFSNKEINKRYKEKCVNFYNFKDGVEK